MKISVITLLIVLTLTVAFAQVLHNRKYRGMPDPKGTFSPYLLMSAALALIADACTGHSCGPYMIACLMMPLSGMFLLTSSLLDPAKVGRWTLAVAACNVVLALLQVICASGESGSIPDRYMAAAAGLAAILQVGLFMYGFTVRVRSVKMVMKTGTVWANVGLGMDALYLLTGNMIVLLYFCACLLTGTETGVHAALAALLLGLELSAYGYRIQTDSMFVLWKKQEQRIIESLKVTSVESATDMSRIDEVYKDIYERVVAYFEREKPFLDSELTINDLVKVLYSNKLYISKAISQFTGRNFCQFVNYYRIKYSTECFKANHDLRIHEMSSMSGFNSIVSFNMAFRLYMGENPSDWCRKEKGRFVKGKK